MFDVTFLIPDTDEDNSNYIPPMPDELMSDQERERLDNEFDRWIDSGMLE